MKLKAFDAFAMGLPGAAVDFPWGPTHRVYKIGGKMFALTGGAPSDEASVTFKADDLSFEIMTKRRGIVPAPYMQRMKWVHVENAAVMDDAELKARVKQSYDMVLARLPRKKQAEIAALGGAVVDAKKAAVKKTSAKKTAPKKAVVKKPAPKKSAAKKRSA